MTTEAAPYTITVDKEIRQFNPVTALLVVICIVMTWIVRGRVYGK
jgi:hypothetical protein